MILNVFATNVVISKGFDNAPALRFNENGTFVRFRIGKKVYDNRAENNTRWINLSVKAFGDVCERIKKMQLKEGSFVNLVGRLDEETWTDRDSNEQRSAIVIILDDIEYASGGGKAKENGQQTAQQPRYKSQNTTAAPENSPNFTGYEPFGGNGMFDMN